MSPTSAKTPIPEVAPRASAPQGKAGATPESAGCEGANEARFFELRGWPVIPLGGAHWVPSGTGARWLMSIPESVFPQVRPEQLADLLRRERMLALRYPSCEQVGLPGGLYVCRDKDYSLRNVVRGIRPAVKGALARCKIRRVEPDELLTQGLECNLDTMRRQGRDNREFSNPTRWRRLVEAAWQVPAIEVTGTFIDGKLAAYMLMCREDGWWNLLYNFSRTSLLEHHPNHTLYFATLERLLRRPDVDAVCAGPKTLMIDDGLHDFKTRIGFKLEPHRVLVRFHPALERMLVSPLVMMAAKSLRAARPANRRLARAAAFLETARATRNGAEKQGLPLPGALDELVRHNGSLPPG